jgi:hypothetical protein
MSERAVDQDVASGVEVAEKGPGYERKVGEPVAGVRRPRAPVVVDEDTHVVREDLGTDSVTFVAAGDAVPVDLAHLPRRRARLAGRKK